ncbi:hypothetical protein [Streptomyces sp. B8F3]
MTSENIEVKPPAAVTETSLGEGRPLQALTKRLLEPRLKPR